MTDAVIVSSAGTAGTAVRRSLVDQVVWGGASGGGGRLGHSIAMTGARRVIALVRDVPAPAAPPPMV